MSEIAFKIDGKDVAVPEDTSVLAAAQRAGIPIPTVCHHEKLKPFGGCRLCVVEVEAGGKAKFVTACTTPVQNGLVVRTRSAQIDQFRKMLAEMLLGYAPESEVLQTLSRDYQADKDRFGKAASFCILCGRCVRYCTEVKRKNAVGFLGRGAAQQVTFIPEIAAAECWDCKECFPLCPTSALQAAFVLANALAGLSSAAAARLHNGATGGAGDGGGDAISLQATAKR